MDEEGKRGEPCGEEAQRYAAMHACSKQWLVAICLSGIWHVVGVDIGAV
jgi:hypothetical protein